VTWRWATTSPIALPAEEAVQRAILDPRARDYAIALDGRKRQVDACGSNMGQCLLQGLIDEDKAPLVAAHLMSPEMFSG
jgi:glycogen debranching enzyme